MLFLFVGGRQRKKAVSSDNIPQSPPRNSGSIFSPDVYEYLNDPDESGRNPIVLRQ